MNLIIKKIVVLLVCFLLTGFHAVAGEWKSFRINAQYRGAIKKSFKNIGCAIAWFEDLKDGNTQIVTHVCAKDPDKRNQTYAFRLNMIVNYSASGVRVVKNIYNFYEGIDEGNADEIQQLMALWCFLRKDAKNRVARDYGLSVEGRLLNLKEKMVRGNKRKEINVYWPKKRSFSGKFFYDYKNNRPVINKFRFKNQRVAISFVAETMKKVTEKFANQSPFREHVFANQLIK